VSTAKERTSLSAYFRPSSRPAKVCSARAARLKHSSAASWVATICTASMASITSRGPISDSRHKVAVSRISFVSAFSLLPRQTVPSTWLAA
jgi:hypothetical protein